MKACPLCKSRDLPSVYSIGAIPVFQNKIYSSEADAKNAVTGCVELVQCRKCGFVFNKSFEPELMEYDETYQNEQAGSSYFRYYLDDIENLLDANGLLKGRVVEIGCGKGYFLDLLANKGKDIIGFDPAYEGDNPRIIKDYFGKTHHRINADTIILRHTLEHVSAPLSFLHTIAETNAYRGKLFIEVPCFDWIRRKKAFWDVFYEHCNYFCKKSLQSLFQSSIVGTVFNDQYLFVIARCSDLRKAAADGNGSEGGLKDLFDGQMARYRKFVAGHDGLWVWGGGAKGSTFVNRIDPERRFVEGIIDINPKKQKKFVAGTGHPVFSPEVLHTQRIQNILVMNNNYLSEISATISDESISLHSLGAV